MRYRLHVLAAVDVNFSAIHVRTRIRAQHVNDLGNFVRRAETLERDCSTIFSVPGERMAVSISPGAIALTRIPRRPKSLAISRVRAARAAFDVE